MQPKTVLLIFSSVLLTVTAIAQNNWTSFHLSPRPPAHPTFGTAMAYLGDEKAILFGGYSHEGQVGSWIFNGNSKTWEPVNTTVEPSNRWYHAMSDIGNAKALLFGGYSFGYGSLNDTWVFDKSTNTWTQMSPPIVPSHRGQLAMAYLEDDKVLLFGGAGRGVRETWVYDLSENSWIQKFPAINPPGRTGHVMANIGGDKVVMFGGQDQAANYVPPQTWVYDLSENSWTSMNPPTNPSERFFTAMAKFCDDQVVLHAGRGGRALSDTWVYDYSNNNWTLQTQLINPGERDGYAMASIGYGRAVAYGGAISRASAELEEYTYIYTGTDCIPPCNINVSAGLDESSYFGYGPEECVTKTALVTGSIGSLSYSWTMNRPLLQGESMTGTGTATVTVCLSEFAELCVTITDGNGCAATDCVNIFAKDVRCYAGNSGEHKVIICHNGNELCVDTHAVPAHLDHGDSLGPCEVSSIVQPRTILMNDNSSVFSVYPNPGKGIFQINTGSSVGILRVINSSGQQVKQINLNGQQRVQLNLELPGIYYLQLHNGREVSTKKLLVTQ